MESVKRLTQAYSQAPWRKQLQAIVTFLLILVSVALVAGVYLSVSARAVAVGSEIQDLREKIEIQEKANHDLESILAYQTSSSVMRGRAQEMGFRPLTADDVVYMEIPGYLERREVSLAPPPGLVMVETVTIAPAFTESLFDWVQDNIIGPSGILAEVRP